jgi:hypothetical protein
MSLELHSLYPSFAIFDDSIRRSGRKEAYEERYKLVGIEGDIYDIQMREINAVPLKVVTSEEVPREVYFWKTGYELLCNDTWIPVIDFSETDCYDGPFTYTVEDDIYAFTDHRINQQMIRREKLQQIEKKVHNPVITIPKFIAELVRKEAIAKKEACPITFTPIEECSSTSLTSCYHLYETAGLNRWLENSMKCPVCKQVISSTCII